MESQARPDVLELPPVPLLLRPMEVAQRIGIGRSKVFQLIARAEIPVIRIGRTVRIPSDLLEEWLREQVEWRRPSDRWNLPSRRA